MSRNFVLGSDTDGVLDDDFLAWFAYKPGLFTLDDPDLGIIEVQWLGGLGAGVVIGSATTSGTVAGVEGYAGSAAGSAVSSGSAVGNPGYFGSVAGAAVTSASVIGYEGAVGRVDGSSITSAVISGSPDISGAALGESLTSGSASGAPNITGLVSGSAVTSGSVIGGPSVSGSVTGESVTNGSVTGTQFIPSPSRGGRSYAPKWDYSKKPLRLLRRSGGVTGSSNSDGIVTGLCGFSGRSVGASASSGDCSGVRWPSDELVAEWARISARKKLENELLMLEIL
jgi:hypothetical protein